MLYRSDLYRQNYPLHANYFGVKCTEDAVHSLTHSEGHEDGISISSWSNSTHERGM